MKSNSRRLNILMITIALTNALFALAHFVIRRTPFSTFYRIAWPTLGLVYALPFYFIWMAARPAYNEDGSLIHGGEDVAAQGGIMEYAHDVIYLCVFVQTALIFTRWALLFFTAIPVYIAYFAISSGVLSSDGRGDEQEAEGSISEFAGMSRKERRKAERQSRKQR